MSISEIAFEPRSWYQVVKPLAPGPGVFFDVGAVIPAPSEYIAPHGAEMTDVQAWAARYIAAGRIALLDAGEAAGRGLFKLADPPRVETVPASVQPAAKKRGRPRKARA